MVTSDVCESAVLHAGCKASVITVMQSFGFQEEKDEMFNNDYKKVNQSDLTST